LRVIVKPPRASDFKLNQRCRHRPRSERLRYYMRLPAGAVAPMETNGGFSYCPAPNAASNFDPGRDLADHDDGVGVRDNR
jgi:hypothetical protein